MATENPAPTTRRRVLVLAAVSFFLGIAAVALIQLDKQMAQRGNEVPQVALRATRWFALAFGLAAMALWFWERRRSHVRVSGGLIAALVAVIATPVATAIALPDDTPSTVVAFDARTGRLRWQRDVALFYSGVPAQRNGRKQLLLNGIAPSGRCNTRPEQFTLDPANGRTISHTKNKTVPAGADPLPAAPSTAGAIELRVVKPPPPETGGTATPQEALNGVKTTQPARPVDPARIHPRLEARDKAGRVLWSTLVDGDRAPPVIYADASVVAVYLPGSFGTVGARRPTGLAADSGFIVTVLDARTGRLRWVTEASIAEAPRFSPTRTFAIEGADLVVHATDTGKVVSRYALTPPVESYPDVSIEQSQPRRSVVLVEGTARRVTQFDASGRVHWTARLPRTMQGSGVATLGDAVYVTGGGALGYHCGGE